MSRIAARSKIIPLSVAWVLFFFAILWCLDFPKPMVDDLVYTGAALHLVAGGDFSNPFLARQGFPSHYYFIYPPLHSYTLTGWLEIFGVSAASMTGFTIALYVIIAIATIAVLRKHGSPVWLEWMVPLGVTIAFLPSGMRPETVAATLVMAGFAITELSVTAGVGLFIGFVLLFLGASCSPRVTIFAAALILCACYRFWQGGPGGRTRRISLVGVLALAGLAVSVLVFLVLIRFRVMEFWHTIHFHSSRKMLFRDFVGHILGVLQWPIVLIPFGLLLYVLGKPKNRLSIIGLFTGAAVPIVALTGGIGLGSLWWFLWLMFVMTAAVASTEFPGRKRVLPALVILTLLVGNRRLVANCYGLLSGNIGNDKGELSQTVRAMRSTPEHPLLVDSDVARYIFDYHLPKGTIDLFFGAPFPGGLPGDRNTEELRKGDIFLAGPESIDVLEHVTLLDLPTPKWTALGLRPFRFEKYPRRVYIIPAESCKAHRPGTGFWNSISPDHSTN